MARLMHRLGGATLAAAAFLSLPMLAATAAPATASPVAAAPQQQKPAGAEYAPTMLVLDASGSMTEADKAGGTRMDSAKRAVTSVVDATPDNAKVGLTVYGTGTGSSPAEKAAGCQDVQVLKQPTTIDKPGIKNAVNGLNPRGYTPIGKALQTAADALPKEGPRSIVLVSDGIDTCAPPDPCETVKTLAGQGIDLVVHTVGFGVDDAARNQLTCVAQTTGGTYTDAPDAKSLEQTLPRVTASALRNYEPSGIPVRGTDQLFQAPVIGAGQYLDSISPNAKQYYSVEAPEGSTLYFAGTVPGQRGVKSVVEAVRIEVFGKDGGSCSGTESEIGTNAEDGAPLTAQKTFDTTKKKNDADCSGAGKYTFGVERGGDGQNIRRPLEILVGIEPAADPAGLPSPATERASFTMPGGPMNPVTGGGTFGTAAELPGTGHYTDQIRFGEYLFYKVKVQWGQSLTARVRFDSVNDNHIVASSRAEIFSPLRRPIGSDNNVYVGNAVTAPSRGEFGKPVPVEYRNRELSDGNMAGQSMAGEYYIGVNLGNNDSSGSNSYTGPVPLVVDISVSGQPHEGPRYQFTSDKQRTDGVFGENAARGGGSGGQPVAQPTAASESSFPTGLVIGGAAFALVAIGGAGIVIAMRKRQPAGPGGPGGFGGPGGPAGPGGPGGPGPQGPYPGPDPDQQTTQRFHR